MTKLSPRLCISVEFWFLKKSDAKSAVDIIMLKDERAVKGDGKPYIKTLENESCGIVYSFSIDFINVHKGFDHTDFDFGQMGSTVTEHLTYMIEEKS